MNKPLEFVGVNSTGMVFTDGSKFFLVFHTKRNADGIVYSGLEVNAGDLDYCEPDGLCGGEVDMRQSDEDAMTPEAMELGDRIAAALNTTFEDMPAKVKAVLTSAKVVA